MAAERLAADAERGFTELGATGDAARCQHHLHELGVQTSRRPGRRGYGTQLSPGRKDIRAGLPNSDRPGSDVPA